MGIAPPAMSPPAIETRDLCRRFGHRWALARLELHVEQGQRLLIVGANGSGKSTLLSVLSTLLPPTRGSFAIMGLDPKADRAEVRRKVGFVRHAHGLYEDLSARDNLNFRARLIGRQIDVGSILRQVGLDDRPEPLRTYSAGMRKRLQLAALRAESPPISLLDEPFSALDPAGCADVASFVRDQDGTVLIASHQVERAAAICDRAILLDQGQLRWQGAADQASQAWRTLQARAVREQDL